MQLEPAGNWGGSAGSQEGSITRCFLLICDFLDPVRLLNYSRGVSRNRFIHHLKRRPNVSQIGPKQAASGPRHFPDELKQVPPCPKQFPDGLGLHQVPNTSQQVPNRAQMGLQPLLLPRHQLPTRSSFINSQ